MDYEQFIRSRITELRMKKGISECKLSYELGHSKGYIQRITSGYALPSMSEFIYMCRYFEITPAEFFTEDIGREQTANRLSEVTKTLSSGDMSLLLSFAERLSAEPERNRR